MNIIRIGIVIVLVLLATSCIAPRVRDADSNSITLSVVDNVYNQNNFTEARLMAERYCGGVVSLAERTVADEYGGYLITYRCQGRRNE